MSWQCSKGHIWVTCFHYIRYDKTWCPRCFTQDKRGKSLLVGINKARKIAKDLGFEILDSTYGNSYTKMKVKHLGCGSEFETTYHNLTHFCACPKCNLRPRINKHEAEEFAKLKGGELIGLADKSRNNSTWRCDKGHEWKASWSGVKKGTWCPFCAGKKAISPLHRIAVSKLYQHKRWDAAKGFTCTLELEDILLALSGKCIYCNKEATNVDRKDSNIGHTKENCVPCCGRCNMVKSNRISYEVMLEVGKVFKKTDI